MARLSREFSMMKNRVVCLFVIVIAGISLAAAQSTKVHSSTSVPTEKPGKDPVRTATKPLTPKSAMPAKGKSSAAATPSAPKGGSKSNAELTRLERQPIKASNPNTDKTAAAKGAPARKPAPANANGSGINSSYQKPTVNKP